MPKIGIEPILAPVTAQKVQTLVSAVVFDSTAEAYTSASLDCSGYRKFLLENNVDVTLVPTDINIQVQFSDDDVTFYNYMDGPFGSLMYEDGAGDKLESVSGECLAKYMRLYVLSSGCSSTNKFTLTSKVILSN